MHLPSHRPPLSQPPTSSVPVAVQSRSPKGTHCCVLLACVSASPAEEWLSEDKSCVCHMLCASQRRVKLSPLDFKGRFQGGFSDGTKTSHHTIQAEYPLLLWKLCVCVPCWLSLSLVLTCQLAYMLHCHLFSFHFHGSLSSEIVFCFSSLSFSPLPPFFLVSFLLLFWVHLFRTLEAWNAGLLLQQVCE